MTKIELRTVPACGDIPSLVWPDPDVRAVHVWWNACWLAMVNNRDHPEEYASEVLREFKQHFQPETMNEKRN